MRVPPAAGVLGLTNSAEDHVSSNVAPGELVSLYGIQIGPAIAASGKIDAANRLSSTLAETEVQFDGTSAPLLYAGTDQINLVVPFDVAGKTSVRVDVRQANKVVSTFLVPVVEAHPAIFNRGCGIFCAAIALNEDGTLNGPDNPAKRGSIVTMWVTGVGEFQPALVDGAIADAGAIPKLPMKSSFGSTFAYAGSAPGMISGILQLNVKVEHRDDDIFVLWAGGFPSETMFLYVTRQ